MTDKKNKLKIKHRVFETLLHKKQQAFEDMRNSQRDELEDINRDDQDKGDMMESPTENLMQEIRMEERSMQHLKDEINRLLDYESFAEKEKVGPTTVVKTSIGNFVVAVPERVFEVDGEKYAGVSEESPIYKELKGHKAGDEVQFNGQQIRIEEVV